MEEKTWRVLRRIFGPKRDEVTGGGVENNGIMRNSVIFTLHQI
jgi:hypothetical protein